MVALVAGVLLGVGLGVIFNAGGTTGGTDIVARILNKYTNISVGKLLFGLDFLILMLILIIFQEPTSCNLYSLYLTSSFQELLT